VDDPIIIDNKNVFSGD